MNKKLLLSLTATALLLLSNISFSQTPTNSTVNLGILESFEAYTGNGGVTNSGGTVTGDVGTHLGIISGFPSPPYTGNTYNADAVTDQARFDLLRLYIHLNALFTDFPAHAPAFGSGETLGPGVYAIGGAGSIAGDLTLDGGGDPNAVFVIKMNGAFTVGAGATVNLTNGTKSSNVFWLISGAISVAAGADVKGTLFSKAGAVGLGADVTLEGRMLSMAGAITMGIGSSATPPPDPSTIQIFCESSCTPAPAVDILGVLSDFTLFSSAGNVANTGITGIIGKIGTNAGAVTGYGGIVIGTQEIANALTAQAASDLDDAYSALMLMTPSVTHAADFNNETLAPGVYHIPGAGSLAGVVILDAANDPNAIFVFRFAGAFNVAAAAKVILINGAKRCNVFWLGGAGVATGAVNIGASSEVQGTFMSHGGASNSGGGVFMAGRQLSTLGAVNTNTAVIYNNPQCVTSSSLNTPSFDHFQIVHDGEGLTCAPEEVTVKACADVNCETFNMDAIDVDLSIYNQTDDTLFKTIPITVNGTTAVMKDTNIPANFSYTNSGRVRLAIENQDYECKNGSSDSCEVKFTKAGFRFLYGDDTTLPNQIAGTVFEKALKLQAVVDDEGVCTGLFKDDISVNLWQENVTPIGTSGLSFSIDGHDIAKEQGEPLTELIFGDDSIATIKNPRYHDAGEIRLHANYDVDGITLSGSSSPFWVSPAELVVSATSGTNKLNGAAATATPTHAAGESFTLTVSALNSLGVITPNYTPETIQLKLERTGPILEDSVDGRLTYASDASLATATGTSTVFESVTLNNFSSGQSVYTDAQYSEVGLLNLDLQDSNYGVPGIVIDATAIDIGRFIPHHFTQAVSEDGAFMADCNTATATSFAYSGQKDVNNKGTISYVINPVLAITAYNKQNVITENYSNAYMKLSAEDVSITAPTVDQKAIGDDDVILLLTANMNEGILSQNDLTALPDALDNALDNGVLHYKFSDNDNFYYNRDANTQVAPFISEINFSTASITDADGVTVEATADTLPDGVEIRFGRLMLQNSFGPETSDLPQPMQIEYFTDDGFIVSSDNNCVSYDSTNIILDTTLTTRALPEHPAATTGNFLAGKTRTIKLAAPGAGKQGKIGVEYQTYEWLRYDWDPDVEVNGVVYNENPSATATFGLFRGNDRIIYQREVFD